MEREGVVWEILLVDPSEMGDRVCLGTGLEDA